MEITTYLLSSQYLIPTPPSTFLLAYSLCARIIPRKYGPPLRGVPKPPLLIFVRVITTSEPASEVPIPPPPLGSLVSYCGVSHFALPRLAHTLENGTWEMRLELTATSPCYLVGTLTSARKGRKIILASPIYNRCILWGCTPVWIRTLTHNTLTHTTLRIPTYQDVFNPY